MSGAMDEIQANQRVLLRKLVWTFTGGPLRTIVFVLVTVGGGALLIGLPDSHALARLAGVWVALMGAVIVTVSIHGMPDFMRGST